MAIAAVIKARATFDKKQLQLYEVLHDCNDPKAYVIIALSQMAAKT